MTQPQRSWTKYWISAISCKSGFRCKGSQAFRTRSDHREICYRLQDVEIVYGLGVENVYAEVEILILIMNGNSILKYCHWQSIDMKMP